MKRERVAGGEEGHLASLGFLWARDSLSGRPTMDSNLELRDLGSKVRMDLRLSSLLACLYQSVTTC